MAFTCMYAQQLKLLTARCSVGWMQPHGKTDLLWSSRSGPWRLSSYMSLRVLLMYHYTTLTSFSGPDASAAAMRQARLCGMPCAAIEPIKHALTVILAISACSGRHNDSSTSCVAIMQLCCFRTCKQPPVPDVMAGGVTSVLPVDASLGDNTLPVQESDERAWQ